LEFKLKKDNRWMTRLRYSYQPFAGRVFLEHLLGFNRSIGNRIPIAADSSQLSCDPVFIVSAGRSGSTLLRSMLAAGGQIAIPAETQMIHSLPIKFNAARRLGWENQARLIISTFESHHNFPLWQIDLSETYQRVITMTIEERSLARIIDEVFSTYARQAFPTAKLWGDQSPIHTLYMPDILRIFPRVKFLHLLRDGRDVVSSKVVKNGDESLFSAVHRWKTCYKRSRQIQKIVGPGQFLEVRYESLVTSPESVLQQICEFIGVDYSASMLDYWKLPSTVEHKFKTFHKNLQKPVFSTSIGSWKERLNSQQLAIVMKTIKPELEYLGYLEEKKL
jgi:hypothetical protein